MSELKREDVVAYLKKNPDFLTRHPELLTALSLPHSPLGASSLLVRQQQVLREKNQQLHSQMQQLIAQANQNEKIFQVFSACHRLLMADLDLAQLANQLESLICERLPLNACRLLPFTPALHTIVEHRLKEAGHYLGRISQQEQQQLFNNDCHSVALYLIGDKQAPQALLAFASDDEQHFDPSLDNLFVGEFVQALREKLANQV